MNASQIGKPTALKHGMSNTPEYRCWTQMISRCYNANSAAFKDYGGRGITVCAEWRSSFVAFFRDMGRRPSAKHWLERKDNDKGYSPDNCCWATPQSQSRNRRSTVMVTLHGKTQCVADWAKERKVRGQFIRNRVSRGWCFPCAIDLAIGQSCFHQETNK